MPAAADRSGCASRPLRLYVADITVQLQMAKGSSLKLGVSIDDALPATTAAAPQQCFLSAPSVLPRQARRIRVVTYSFPSFFILTTTEANKEN